MKYKLLRKVCQINMDKVGYKAYLQLLGNQQHYPEKELRPGVF